MDKSFTISVSPPNTISVLGVSASKKLNVMMDLLNEKIHSIEELMRSKFNCVGETICQMKREEGLAVFLSWTRHGTTYKFVVTEITGKEGEDQNNIHKPLVHAKSEYRIMAIPFLDKIYQQVEAMDNTYLDWAQEALNMADEFLKKRS